MQNDEKIDYIVIPARGGSKRIPRKNLALFNGKSMLECAIDLAKKVAKKDEGRNIEVSKNVIITSEDSNILNVASAMGARAFKRDENLADDLTPTLPVIIDVIKKCAIKPESSLLCLYPTAMFARENHIFHALKMLKSTDVAYVVSAIENTKALRSFSIKDSRINIIFKEYIDKRSQDLPKIYNDAGQFYLGYAKSFLDEVPLLGHKSTILELESAWDIDTQRDLDIAQVLFRI